MESKMVIDNFLSDEDYSYVKQVVLSPNLPWVYGEKVSCGDWDHGITNPEAKETFGINRDIFNYGIDYKDPPEILQCFRPVLRKINQINGGDCQLLRLRLSMKFFKHGFNDGDYNLPHIDYAFPHKSLILYMNDTDGDTYMFNEKFEGEYLKTFTVKERISPKENRALVFDGLQYHTASNPLYHDTRVIININYI